MMFSSTNQTTSLSAAVSETPPNCGRSRRKSTMLVSAASRSVLLQLSSPKLGQYVEDTPDNTVNFKSVAAETPDNDETVFDTSQIPDTTDRKPKSILKTKHGPSRVVRNLPTIIPVVQSQRVSPRSKVMEGTSTPTGRKPRVGSAANLDISGIGLLTPEVKSAKKAVDKRRGRRSNISREQFLSFVFQKEASPPISTPEPAAKHDLEILDHDSDSSDDGWEALKNSDGSMKKFLPKADGFRMSVVISGNIKSRTKNQLSVPKAQRIRKVNKNLSDGLDRNIVVNGTGADETKLNHSTFTDESCITLNRRKSHHKTIEEEVSPTEPDIFKPQPRPSFISTSINSLSMNSDIYQRTKLSLSIQNFNTDSAIKKGEYHSEQDKKNKATPINVTKQSPAKERVRPRKLSLFAANLVETPVSRKRKNEEQPNAISKKAKSDPNYVTGSPMELTSSAVKISKPFRPPVKGGAKSSQAPQPMMDSRTPGRDSTRISTINVMKSPVLSRCPTDPIVHVGAKTDPQKPTDLTQKACILDGVVVFIDFRAENENRGKVIKNAARELGAGIADKIGPTVTHVIFKDGGRINYLKAKKLGLPIVSAGWLEESKKEGKKIPESQFPSVSIEKYDSPGLFHKMKKMKSMQPKTLDEDFEAVSKAQDRKQKMLEKKLLKEEEAEKLKNPVSKMKYPPHEHYYKGSPHNTSRSTKSKSNPDSSLKDVLKEFQTPSGTPVKLQMASLPNLLSPTSPSECDFDTPLARRLANRYQSPQVARNILGSESSPALLQCSGQKEIGVESKSLPATPNKSKEPMSSLTSSNLETTSELKGNSKQGCSIMKEIPQVVVERDTPIKPDDGINTVDESIVMRRSRRRSTAISTIATSQAVAQEINNKKKAGKVHSNESLEAVQDPNNKELLPSPVVSNKRVRGSLRKTIEESGVSIKTSFGNTQMESTRLALKNPAPPKTSFGDTQLESTRMVQKSQRRKSSKFQTPFKPTVAEKDLVDTLGIGNPNLSQPKLVAKQKKFVLLSNKKSCKTIPGKDFSKPSESVLAAGMKRKLEQSPSQPQVGLELQTEETPSKKLRL